MPTAPIAEPEPLGWLYHPLGRCAPAELAFVQGMRLNRFIFHNEQRWILDDSVVADAPPEALRERPSRGDHWKLGCLILHAIAKDASKNIALGGSKALSTLRKIVYSLLHEPIEEGNKEWLCEEYGYWEIRASRIPLVKTVERIELLGEVLMSVSEKGQQNLREALRADTSEGDLRWFELGELCDQGACPQDAYRFAANPQPVRARSTACLCEIYRNHASLIGDLRGLPIPECLCSRFGDVASAWRHLMPDPKEYLVNEEEGSAPNPVRSLQNVLGFASRRPGDLLPAPEWAADFVGLLDLNSVVLPDSNKAEWFLADGDGATREEMLVRLGLLATILREVVGTAAPLSTPTSQESATHPDGPVVGLATQATLLADGPRGIGRWVYNGKEFGAETPMKPVSHRIAAILFKKHGVQVNEQTIRDELGSGYEGMELPTLLKHASNATCWFRAKGIPLKLCKVRRTSMLVMEQLQALPSDPQDSGSGSAG